MTLPNFLHIGINKAASSWLWRCCMEHPDVYVPKLPDNVNFFTVAYHRGLAWYSNQYFADYDGQKACGEFSNSYLNFDIAMQRIVSDLPDCRFTVTLRHPVERAFLSWAHQHLKNKPSGLDGRKGIGYPLDRVVHHHGHGMFRLYMQPGFYAHHLKAWQKLVPADRLHITLYDDLKADNAAYLQSYFAFLGVDPDFTPQQTRDDVNPDTDDSNIHKWVPEPIIEEMLLVYQDDISELEQMLGRDLSAWRTV